MLDRRSWLQTSAATGLAICTAGPLAALEVKKPKLKKAIKYSMIGFKGTIAEQFTAVKKLGFVGVEVDSPSNVNKEEMKKAIADTGVVVHGVIDSVHWKDTLSSPKEDVRAKGLAALQGAIEDAKFFGADTALLVPGVVNKDASYQECWDRSQAEVKKVLPLAEKLNVKIAIEVVWNNFITKPEQLVEYVDAFKSPYVGAYFDASNMLKYGVPAAEWIRKLGKRMLKLDFKGYNATTSKWVPIGEGTEDWPEILKACGEVGYDTWATAEVQGGDEKWLAQVSAKMDQILELK
jgi:L-ribulose-5-phosphate 3-epimerase